MGRTFRYCLLLSLSLAHAQSLSELYVLSQETSMSWKSKTLENETQQLSGEVARGALLPTLAFQVTQQAGLSYYGSDPKIQLVRAEMPFDQTNMTAQLSMPLYKPSAERAYEAANLSEKIAALDYKIYQNAFVIELASRYFDVLRCDKSLQLSNQALVMKTQLYADIQQRFDVGLVAMTDLKEAQSALDQAKATQIRATLGLSQAQWNLKNIVSQEITDFRDIRLGENVRLTPRALEQLSHPSVLKAQLATQYYYKQIEMAQAELLPVWSAFSSFSKAPLNQNISHSVNSIAAGVSMTWAPPAGMASMTQIDQATYRYQASQAQYAQTTLEHATQRELYTQQAYSLYQQIYAQEATVKSAKIYLEAVEASFDAGQRTTTDVLEAQQFLTQQHEVLYGLIYDSLIVHLKLGLENSYAVNDLLADIDTHLTQDWRSPNTGALPTF